MMMQSLLFYVFAGLSVLGALGVVFARHPVRGVLSLVLTLVAGAIVWLLMESEFLALILVVVYVGAVMVLFLFVVMMVDVDVESQQKTYVSYWPAAIVLVLALFGLLVCVFKHPLFGMAPFHAPLPHPAGYSNVSELGMLLFTQYLYPFELAGVLLLAAMMAAIALTFRGRKAGTKTQVIREQVRVKASDRLTLVDVETNSHSVTVDWSDPSPLMTPTPPNDPTQA